MEIIAAMMNADSIFKEKVGTITIVAPRMLTQVCLITPWNTLYRRSLPY